MSLTAQAKRVAADRERDQSAANARWVSEFVARAVKAVEREIGGLHPVEALEYVRGDHTQRSIHGVVRRSIHRYVRLKVDDLTLRVFDGVTLLPQIEVPCASCGEATQTASRVAGYVPSLNATPDERLAAFIRQVAAAMTEQPKCWNCAANVVEPCASCGRKDA